MRGICLCLLLGHALLVAWPTSQKGRTGLIMGSFNHPPWWTSWNDSGAGIDYLDRMDSINNLQFYDLQLVNVDTRLENLDSDDNIDQIYFGKYWIIHDLKVKNRLKVSMERDSGKATLTPLKPFQHGTRKESYDAMFFYEFGILNDELNKYKSEFIYQDFDEFNFYDWNIFSNVDYEYGKLARQFTDGQDKNEAGDNFDQIDFDKDWTIHDLKVKNELKVSMERDSGKATITPSKPFQHGTRKESYDAMCFYDFFMLDNGFNNYETGFFYQNFIMVHKDDNRMVHFEWIIKLVFMEMEMEMDKFICLLLFSWNCLFLVLWIGNCYIYFF